MELILEHRAFPANGRTMSKGRFALCVDFDVEVDISDEVFVAEVWRRLLEEAKKKGRFVADILDREELPVVRLQLLPRGFEIAVAAADE